MQPVSRLVYILTQGISRHNQKHIAFIAKPFQITKTNTDDTFEIPGKNIRHLRFIRSSEPPTLIHTYRPQILITPVKQAVINN
jgi:hypothetical protein